MDIWKFYDIRMKRHVYCNPLGVEKLERFLKLLYLPSYTTVLDIASGKGEFLIRLSQLYDITGVGVDISPYCIQDSQTNLKERMRNAQIQFIQMDAKHYRPTHQFDVTSCMGASWIWNGYKNTLEALKDMTNSGGIIIVGEPFWLKTPDPEYLHADNMKREDFADSHYENIETGEQRGLICIYTIVSDHNDWDHYENQGWWAIDEYSRAVPDDPDLPELLTRMQKEKHIYLQWARDTMGWALYVFRKP